SSTEVLRRPESSQILCRLREDAFRQRNLRMQTSQCAGDPLIALVRVHHAKRLLSHHAPAIRRRRELFALLPRESLLLLLEEPMCTLLTRAIQPKRLRV